MIALIFGTLLLVALVRVLIATENPLLCAIIFGIFSLILYFLPFLFSTSFQFSIVNFIAILVVKFGLAYLYFWLLRRFYERGMLWYVILLCGIFLLV